MEICTPASIAFVADSIAARITQARATNNPIVALINQNGPVVARRGPSISNVQNTSLCQDYFALDPKAEATAAELGYPSFAPPRDD